VGILLIKSCDYKRLQQFQIVLFFVGNSICALDWGSIYRKLFLSSI
jgi:hypothetical protein